MGIIFVDILSRYINLDIVYNSYARLILFRFVFLERGDNIRPITDINDMSKDYLVCLLQTTNEWLFCRHYVDIMSLDTINMSIVSKLKLKF